MTADRDPADRHLDELWSKVDAFTERVAERYPGALACAPGCSDCCRRELSVTSIEAARIAAVVRDLPPPARDLLAARSRSGEPCVALEADGRCAIYAARPLVCRSHGVPLRFVEPDPPAAPPVAAPPAAAPSSSAAAPSSFAAAPPPSAPPPADPSPRRAVALPVLDVCPKNFVGHDLAAVDVACVLDQRTLSVMLGAIDALFARAHAAPEGRRLALRDVVRDAAAR